MALINDPKPYFASRIPTRIFKNISTRLYGSIQKGNYIPHNESC